MLGLILKFYNEALRAIKEGVSINKLTKLAVIEKIGRARYFPEDEVDKNFDIIEKEITAEIDDVIRKGAEEL